MSSFRNQQAIRQRVWIGSALVVTLAVGVVLGTFLPPRQAEAQPTVTFDSDVVLLFSFIKPAAASDYEGVMQKLSDALQQSQNTEEDRQAQAPLGQADGLDQQVIPEGHRNRHVRQALLCQDGPNGSRSGALQRVHFVPDHDLLAQLPEA